MTNEISYDNIIKSIKQKTDITPSVGIICGSGLNDIADQISESVSIPYQEIPHFPRSTAQGHKGNLVFGKLNGVFVVAFQGRWHGYEGHAPHITALPVRVMKRLGIHTVIVTNAAGGLDKSYNIGDIMIISDHIGLFGENPLTGPNDDNFGPRFPPMSDAYSLELRKIAKDTAKQLGMSSFVREGVYVRMNGPSFETSAECRILNAIGANAVGMSTVPEVIVARHCGLNVLAMSLITNKVAYSIHDQKASHEEVLETGVMRGKDVCRLIQEIVGRIHKP